MLFSKGRVLYTVRLSLSNIEKDLRLIDRDLRDLKTWFFLPRAIYLIIKQRKLRRMRELHLKWLKGENQDEILWLYKAGIKAIVPMQKLEKILVS